MRNRPIFAASSLLLVLAVAACGSSSKAASGEPSNPPGTAAGQQGGSTPSGTTINIGIMTNLSGVSSEAYKGVKPAATAWEKSVNASGGINGHPVKVIVEDSAADGAKGLSDAKDLVENKHVVALVPIDSSIDTSIVSYTKSQAVPVVSPYNAYPIWNQTPGWFGMGIQASGDSQRAALKIAKDDGDSSLAAVVCAEVAACDVDANIRNNAAAAGVKYEGILKLSASAPNYTAQCIALKNKKVDVLYMGVSSGVSTKFSSNCATQDYTPKMFFPYHAFQPGVASISGLNALAMLPTVPWYADVPATKDFRDAMSQYGDMSKADETSMYAWTGLEMIRYAAKNTSGSVTKQTEMDALFQVKDVDLGGLIAAPVTYSPGQPSPRIECYFVGGFQDGKFTLPQGPAPKCLTS